MTKRAERRGRKWKPGLIRNAKGHSRQHEAEREEREADVISIALRQPHRRLAASPRDQRLAYPLGRLAYAGLIDGAQLDTGHKFNALVRLYGRLKGIPITSGKSPMVGMVHSGGGFYRWETETETDKRLRSIEADYDACHDTLLDLGRVHRQGRNILIVCRDICIQEVDEITLWRRPDGLGNLRLGLNALGRVL